MSTSFRLLDLPLELQHNVFRKVYDKPFTLRGVKNCAFSISWYDAPPINLLLACRHIRREAQPIYRQSFKSLDVSGLDQTRLRRWLNMSERSWLLPQIRTLVYGPYWYLYNGDDKEECVYFSGMQLDTLRLEFKETFSIQESEYMQTLIEQRHLSHLYKLARDTLKSLDIHASTLELVCSRIATKSVPDRDSMISAVHDSNRVVIKDLNVLFDPFANCGQKITWQVKQRQDDVDFEEVSRVIVKGDEPYLRVRRAHEQVVDEVRNLRGEHHYWWPHFRSSDEPTFV